MGAIIVGGIFVAIGGILFAKADTIARVQRSVISSISPRLSRSRVDHSGVSYRVAYGAFIAIGLLSGISGLRDIIK